jgi:hypothetical protein
MKRGLCFTIARTVCKSSSPFSDRGNFTPARFHPLATIFTYAVTKQSATAQKGGVPANAGGVSLSHFRGITYRLQASVNFPFFFFFNLTEIFYADIFAF